MASAACAMQTEKYFVSNRNIFYRNGRDHFCEGGDWTAANHKLYAVTYDHIFHKYELLNEKKNYISRPFIEQQELQIFIILHKNYEYEYDTDQRDEPQV